MWSVDNFLFSYVLIFINAAIYLFWKFWKKTKFIKPSEADLITGIKEIEEHEYNYYSQDGHKETSNRIQRLFGWVF